MEKRSNTYQISTDIQWEYAGDGIVRQIMGYDEHLCGSQPATRLRLLRGRHPYRYLQPYTRGFPEIGKAEQSYSLRLVLND